MNSIRIILLCFLFSTSRCFSAEFGVIDDGNLSGISITGEIKKGDYAKFQRFLMTGDNVYSFGNVFLTSPGGDVVEALKFANLFDKSFANTWVVLDQGCYSSCFIMWAGGVERSVILLGKIGVHRITLKDRSSDIKNAKNLISPMSEEIGVYLSRLGIPRGLIDKMNETPASSMYVLDAFELRSSGWQSATEYQPVYFDVIEKHCGTFPDPYRGYTVREKPRNAEVTSAITNWVKCKDRIRNKNKVSFFLEDFKNLKQGKGSIMIPKDMIDEARAKFD